MLNISKKFMSLILVLCLMCSMPSVSVFATSDNADESQNIQTDISDDMNVKSINSFGNLLTSELGQETDKQEENNGINIFSVAVLGKTATAEFETLQDSTLVVAIYDESGVEMLASGRTKVTKDDATAEVTIDIETMPKYFYLKAFLVDEEVYRPLCTAYESPNYTQEMQEFFAKTTDDFESEKVLNLNNDKTNNFAVYNDDTVIIEPNDTENQVVSADNERRMYVIENADDTITSLQIGDVFTYSYDDENILIVKVANISIDGTTATIYGDDVEMDEVFDYVKIDETSDLSNAEVDTSTCDEGVTYEGTNGKEIVNSKGSSAVGAEFEGSMGTSISLKFQSLIEGGLQLTITAKTKLFITLQYQYVEFSIDYSAKISIAIKAKFAEKKFKLTTIGISPVPGVYIEFTPSIVVESDVQIELSGTLMGSVGIRASGDKGIESVSKSPRFKSELKVKGTVFIGLSMEPRVGVLGGVVSVGLEAKGGAELEASMNLYDSSNDDTQALVLHDCDQCIKGEIYIKFSMSADVCFLRMERFKFKRTFLESKLKIFDFYYSLDNMSFGFSACPYLKYKTTVTVKDENGNAVSGATVYDEHTTDSNGKTEFYLNGGYYIITAKYNNLTGANLVSVEGEPALVVITLSNHATDSEINNFGNSGTIGDEDNDRNSNVTAVSLGEHHSGATTQNGDLYVWGNNEYGQLGNGTTTDSSTPKKIMSKVKSISLGCCHSGAITENGDLYMWGCNNYGELGDGTTTNRYTPTKIMSNVKSVSLGYHRSGAITENGDLYMWGNNDRGVLGDGTETNRYIPTKIKSNVKSVSLSSSNSAAIDENSDLYMWGRNFEGQIGDGTTTNKYTPTKIMSNVKSVGLGYDCSGAIAENGDLYMWGTNHYGQLGDGTRNNKYTPTKIMSDVKSVSFDDFHSGAITDNGDLYMWGWNKFGQLGESTITNRYTPTKIMSNVKEVSLKGYYSGAITEDGDLYMWGRILDGTTTDSSIPIKIISNVKFVSFGYGREASITENGELYMWGYNRYGEIGNGTITEYEDNPTKISIPATVPYNLLKSVESTATNSDYKVEVFTDLLPNEKYNFYSMKTQNAENPFGSVNLLYITQATTDENGNLNITYKPDEKYDQAINFVVPLKQTDLSTATVTLDNPNYNGEIQYINPVVILDGKTLVEGENYDLSGDYCAKEAGSYKVTISGRGLYEGEVDFYYTIYSNVIGDVNNDGKVSILDATVLQKYLAGLDSLSDEQLAVSDTNGDGQVTVLDATAIQKYLANLVSSLG